MEKPKVHYSVHNNPPPIRIMSQTNLVHAPHLIYWRSSLILSSNLPSKWFLYLRLPTTNPICTPLSPHSRPYHSSSFDHRNSIWWGLQIVQLYSMQFPPVPCYLVPLRLNISTLFSYIFSLRSSLSVSDQVSHPYKTAGKFIVHTHTHTHTHTSLIDGRWKRGLGMQVKHLNVHRTYSWGYMKWRNDNSFNIWYQ